MNRNDGAARGLAVGITGGIACGKSEVGRILQRDEGVPVLEADEVAHQLMRPGRPVYERVVERFGPGVVGDAGEIDRAKLGRRVFADPAEREALNGLVHPAVMERISCPCSTRRGRRTCGTRSYA
jgi:dephospho-CoA kinase